MTGAIAVPACGTGAVAPPPDPGSAVVALAPTRARALDGSYISWREHLIDDEAIGGGPIRGSDGLSMADLDRDGHLDIVSVHEADTTYDGVAAGHVRLAFGSADPDSWTLTTLAEGAEAGAAEDVTIADVNGDGYPDVVVACELAQLIYFQNPGLAARTVRWERVIPPLTLNRGSFIRVFLADLDGDGRPEVVAANKDQQNPARDTNEIDPLSWYDLSMDPLAGAWVEHELGRVVVPINAQPFDLDRDGDLDVVGGSRGEARILWFENRTERGDPRGPWERHDISRRKRGMYDKFIARDMDGGDGDLDFVSTRGNSAPWDGVFWLEQVRTAEPARSFTQARATDSEQMPLPGSR